MCRVHVKAVINDNGVIVVNATGHIVASDAGVTVTRDVFVTVTLDVGVTACPETLTCRCDWTVCGFDSGPMYLTLHVSAMWLGHWVEGHSINVLNI